VEPEQLAGHLAAIEADGYTILHDVLEPELVTSLREELARLAVELGTKPARNGFEGTNTLRIYNLLVHGRLFEQVPVHPEILPVVQGVLDDSPLVSSLSSIDIGPGEVAQPIHADDQIMPLPKPHVATVCNTMWALTDFTEANGATRIIPGSHLADHSPTYGEHYDSIPAEMGAGSVLVWHGSLWHGGGANTTSERRVGLAMNYCAGWVRQQENQQLGIPVDVARRFPPRLRELCGFGVYHGLIGHIDRKPPTDVVLGPVPDLEPVTSAEDRPGGAGMIWDDA
jgi:ectoine hydroxylase-related dioxygenase (phytanoyl-CoA dioxygenase family)